MGPRVDALAAKQDEPHWLERLFEDLDGSGFKLTAEQRTKAIAIALFYQAQGTAGSGSTLQGLLGPVLCTSARQQTQFHETYTYWAKAAPRAGVAGDPPGAERDGHERQAGERDVQKHLAAATRRSRLQRMRLTAALLAALLPVAIGFDRLALHRAESPGRTTIGTPVPAAPPTAAAPSEVPSSVEPEVTPSGIYGIAVAAHERWGPLTVLIVWVPLCGVTLLLMRSGKWLAPYIRRRQVEARETLRHVLGGISSGEHFVTERFFTGVQPMRRRIELASKALDVNRTIESTAAAAGLFTPVFASRLVVPEYVVLCDSRSREDHLSKYSRLLVHALSRGGVQVNVYEFDRDPRRLSTGFRQRVIDVDEIVHDGSASRLIVFGDGDGFIDYTTGRLHEWGHRFTRWTSRVLMTPRDPARWGALEYLLESQLGLVTFPATEEGVLLAAAYFGWTRGHEWIDQRSRPAPVGPSSSEALFGVGIWRWLDDEPPLAEAIDTLITALRQDLGPRAFDWLCAIAVYPQVYWSLTLHLGAPLARAGPPSAHRESLLAIARLPWLRYGRMPEWLRERLIAEMSPAWRTAVRRRLGTLFVCRTSPSNRALTIELGSDARPTPGMTSDDRTDRLLINFLTRREAEGSDFPLSRGAALALRLQQRFGVFRDLAATDERRAMRSAAEELSEWAAKHPPGAIVARAWSTPWFGPETADVVEYWDPEHRRVLREDLVLIRLRPNQNTLAVVDADSAVFLADRRTLTSRIASISVMLMTLAIWVLYRQYFDNVDYSARAFVILAVTMYAPILLLWFVLLRPLVRLADQFPTVPEGVVKTSAQSEQLDS